MTLPLSEPPPWFQPSLLLHSKQKIVVLDDDISIHGIWRRRLDISNKDKCDVEFLSFTSGLEFKKYYRKLNTEASEAGAILFLIDIELLNQKQNGLDIVEELDLTNRLNQNVIIVTSRFDEPHIHSRCIKNNIKLIPKNMAGFISIEIEQPTARYDCILIDDDLLNHMTWSMYAKEKNKSFKSFYNVSDFLNEAGLIDKETPIYIDSNLGPEIKGEIFALDVSKLGFTKIFISTGYDSTLLNISDCVTGVVGKDPFF